jgi:hypothetical protein
LPTNLPRFRHPLDSFSKVAGIHLNSAGTGRPAGGRCLVDATPLTGVNSLSTSKDVQSSLNVQAAAKPALAKTVAYTKGVYDVLAGAAAEINTLAEAQAAEVGKQVTEAIDKVTEKAPAGTEPAVAFVKSLLSASTTAVDQATKSTKQVFATAEANVATAFAALEKPLAHA